MTVPGGLGFSPDPLLGSQPSGNEGKESNGGNGGNGGQVRIVYCNSTSSLLQPTEQILDELEGSAKNWPSDFKGDVKDFMEVLMREDVQANLKGVYTVPELWKTVDAALKSPKELFRKSLRSLLLALTAPDREVRAALTQTVNVQGGAYGKGWKGGKNGQSGTDGTFSVVSTTAADETLQSETCFVRPAQCRMLLEKARSFYFSGSDMDKAKSANILQQLQRRLQFLEKESSLLETKLGEVYRKAEIRLCIPSGPPDREPASIRLLQKIEDEAKAALGNIYLGLDYYNHAQGDVPRCSYQFYKDAADELLKHLEELEGVYRKYSEALQDKEKKAAIIRKGIDTSLSSISLKKSLSYEAGQELRYIEIEISKADESIKPAKVQVDGSC